MTASRRAKIEALLKDDPDDVFLRYSLALELEATPDWEAGLEILEGLARATPPYVPAFHMAARSLIQRDRVNDARRALREGIEAARAAGESHAAAEMAELRMSLGDAGEG
jgi:tetratricopeptide (TPR) repeat protein